MNTKIEIDVELQGDLYCQPGNKKPDSVENFKVMFRDENITAKIESKLLEVLEREFLEMYADDCGDKKHEYVGE